MAHQVLMRISAYKSIQLRRAGRSANLDTYYPETAHGVLPDIGQREPGI